VFRSNFASEKNYNKKSRERPIICLKQNENILSSLTLTEIYSQHLHLMTFKDQTVSVLL